MLVFPGSCELSIEELESDCKEDVLNREELVSTLNPNPYEWDRCVAFSYAPKSETCTVSDLCVDIVASLRHLSSIPLLQGIDAIASICAEREDMQNRRGDIESILICLRDQTVWIGESDEIYSKLAETADCMRIVKSLDGIVPILNMIERLLDTVSYEPKSGQDSVEADILSREKMKISELYDLIGFFNVDSGNIMNSASAGTGQSETDETDIGDQILRREVVRLNELLDSLPALEQSAANSRREKRSIPDDLAGQNESVCTPASDGNPLFLPTVHDVISGTIIKFSKKFAFVDCGDFRGRIPVREVTWDHIGNPEQTLQRHLQIGQCVNAKVIGYWDNQVILSLRQLLPNPYEIFACDSVVDVEIDHIGRNGGFAVVINTSAIGYIPQSEMPLWMSKARGKASQRGKRYKARILRVNGENGELKLSLLKAGNGVRPAPASQLV